MENNFVNENKDRLGIHRMNEISDMCVCAVSENEDWMSVSYR